MERCILGSSRYGAWINLKKITPQVLIYKNYAFLCGERHNIIIFGKINRTDFVQDIKNPSKVAERKQSATSMPCVCCDVHTYGGFLFITIR